MKIIFFGLGSIGQRHAKIIQENYQHDLYAFRSQTNHPSNKLGIKELFTWDEIKQLNPEIAFITNPTFLHIDTAIKCAEIGCKLFIEKPIGKDSENLDKLITIAKKKNIVTYIAYNLRFNPVINKLKEYITIKKPLHVRVVCTSFYPLWRTDKNHLESYSAKSEMGGGVILDLSHELDYIVYILADIKKIDGKFSKVSNVTIDAEDYADLIVSTDLSNVNVHINFLSQILQRYIQIDFGDLTVIGDLINSEVREYEKEKLKKTIKLDYNKGQEYIEQLKYFFDNIENPHMMNNLVEASDLFRKIVNFKRQ